MRKIVFAVVTLAIAVFALGFVSSHSSGQENKLRKIKEAIPGRYIVVLEDWSTGDRGKTSQASAVAEELGIVYRAKVKGVYKHALNGFVAEMNEKDAAELSKDARVKFIEEDGLVYANTTQTGATFGLDRIDQRDLPLNGSYNYTPDGSGVKCLYHRHRYQTDTHLVWRTSLCWL